MELSSGANERTLDIIYSWIDDSDFVLLLLGGRYGSLDRASGLSYAELEYNYAKSHAKPVIVLWVTDAYLEKKVAGRSASAEVTYERENIDKWHTFKQRVTGDGFCIPISDPAELEPKVFAALTRSRPATVPVAGSGSAPYLRTCSISMPPIRTRT